MASRVSINGRRRRVRLEPGARHELPLQLERWIDMPARGWYSSDGHTHSVGGITIGDPVGKGYLGWTPALMHRVQMAEGLHVLNVQAMVYVASIFRATRGFR